MIRSSTHSKCFYKEIKKLSYSYFHFSDELDAPDLTVLDFNNLSPVPSRSLPISPIDAPDVSSDKEYFQRYSRREIEYWSVGIY